MRIGKPLILTITPIGIALGLYEAYRVGPGIFFLMIALMSFIGVAIFSVVRTVRRERAEEERRKRDEAPSS
jgi:hypothetical protein